MRVARMAVACLLSLAVPFDMTAQQAPGLRLVIETERPSVALGEPVYLTARVRNEGSAAARLIPLLQPSDGLLVISMSGPRGERLGFVPLGVRDSETPPSDLAPGAQVATSFPVFFGASGWTMRTPGTYTLRARFTVHDGQGAPRELRSDSLTIRVGDQPAELATALLTTSAASEQAGKFLTWSGGDHLGAGQELLASLVTRFPGAALIDHYRLALGRSLGRPFKDYTRSAVRPADPARSVAALEQVRDSVVPAVLRIQKYLGLATGYRALGRSPDATRALTAARALAGERAELAEFREAIDRAGRPQGGATTR